MPDTQGVLQQKAYPSASAFDQIIPVEQTQGVFGAPAQLPGLSQAQRFTPRLADPGTELAYGAFPAISLEDVHNPALHGALGLSSEPLGFSSTESSAFSAASPFGPDETVAESAPLTGVIPLVSSPSPAPPLTAQGMVQASYPSVSAMTTSLPLLAPKRTHRWMPSSLKAMVQADQSLTAPIRGLGRIAQKQFSTRRKRDRLVREKEQARDVLNFTLRLSETMFHYGADTLDVDSAIVAVCSAYGLDEIEVDITNQSVIINYVSDIDGEQFPERFSHTVMRVVRSNSDNYASLADIYELIHNITHKDLSREDAQKRLTDINSQKKPYPPLVVFLANLASAAFLTCGIGGSIQAAIVSVLVFVVIFFVGRLIAKLQMPSFFTMAASAGVITFAALSLSDKSSFLTQIGAPVSAPHIVAAGLIMLLPTAKLVSAAQDAINGFPLTAAGKSMSTGISFLGLVVGIGAAVTALSFLGASQLAISETKFASPPLWASIVFMTLSSLTLAVTTYARGKTLVCIALVTLLGLASYYGFNALFGMGAGRGNTAVAAIVIGASSTLLAYRKHAPQAIYSIPALTFLLPGLSIFRGMYTMTVESNSSLGLDGMITAASIVVAMAAGVALGTYLMQYCIQRFSLEYDETSTTATTVLDR